MVKPETQLYKFDEFQIDTVKRVLLHGTTPVPLPSRAFDVLLALVEHNQYVLDKDELMRLVWGDRVVEENNLTRHISTLRKALHESPNDHRYIVTVPGRGYIFVAEVEKLRSNGLQDLSGKRNAVPDIESDKQISHGPELVGRLDGYGPPAAARAATLSRSRWLGAAVFMLILACGGLLSFKLVKSRSQPISVNSYRGWDIVRLTHTGGAIFPAISPDGKYLAYVNREPGRESIWIQQLTTYTQQQIVPPDRFNYLDLHFSSDGSELYFTRSEGTKPLRSLYRMPVLGGVATKLRDDIDSHVALSRDGARLCFTRRNGESKSEFVITDAYGVEERVLAHGSIEFPAWSPDGKAIAFSAGNTGTGGEDMSIQEIQLDDGATREISAKRWGYVSHKTWMPDGSGLIVCGSAQKANVVQLWFVAYPSGDARPLSGDLDRFRNMSLTADARMLAAEQVVAVSDIWSVPLANLADAKKVGVWGGSGLCVLPDGRIVYSSVQSGGQSKIWIMNADGTQQKQLTTDGSNEGAIAASPDGRFIVFVSNRTGNFEIWRMSTDGGNLVQLTNSKGSLFPSVSPDGRWVISVSSSDGHLYKVPLEGGAPQRVAANAVGASAVSPDGKLIAYVAHGREAYGIAVSSFDDGSPIREFEIGLYSFLNNTSLKWTPDGKALLYSASSDGAGNIWMQPLDGGRPKQVTDFKADGIYRFDVSNDGKNLVCARGGWKHDIVLIKNFK